MSELSDKPQEAVAAPLCIDCRYCADGDAPRWPGNLMCQHPDPYLRTGVYYCEDRRRVPHYCGEDAAWFEDAMEKETAK